MDLNSQEFKDYHAKFMAEMQKPEVEAGGGGWPYITEARVFFAFGSGIGPTIKVWEYIYEDQVGKSKAQVAATAYAKSVSGEKSFGNDGMAIQAKVSSLLLGEMKFGDVTELIPKFRNDGNVDKKLDEEERARVVGQAMPFNLIIDIIQAYPQLATGDYYWCRLEQIVDQWDVAKNNKYIKEDGKEYPRRKHMITHVYADEAEARQAAQDEGGVVVASVQSIATTGDERALSTKATSTYGDKAGFFDNVETEVVNIQLSNLMKGVDLDGNSCPPFDENRAMLEVAKRWSCTPNDLKLLDGLKSSAEGTSLLESEIPF